MRKNSADLSFLGAAVKLARKGEGHTRPNPPVGAVIVRNGEIIGEGYHHRCGKPHAEVMVIKAAKRRGASATDFRDSTLYVTLEPCSKPGRVGACTDAIIAAGIQRVVYAVEDPNPVNRGRARTVLKKAGIKAEHIPLREAEELIAPFKKHITTGLPFVTVKLAMSLDGKIADDFGDAKWVSSSVARKLTGTYRESVDAIMVGAETVRRDNPSLLSHGKRKDDLIRVIVSRSGKLPQKAQVFTDGAKNDTLVFPDAELALRELGKIGVMHVLCEGGLKLATSLAEAGLVDEWVTVLSPCIIGNRPITEKIPLKLEALGVLRTGELMLSHSF